MNEARDNPRVIAPPPLIALATLLLGLALDWLLPSFILRGIFWFWTRLFIGGILIAAGVGIAIVAVRSFRRAGTNVEPWKPTVTLVTEGIHGFMRNPMYTAIIMFVAGTRYRPWVRLDVCSGRPRSPNSALWRGEARGTLPRAEIWGELSRVYAKSTALLGVIGGTVAKKA